MREKQVGPASPNDRGKYRLFVSNAFNAMGLIGTEHNGIVILDECRKQVVLDRHAEAAPGMGGCQQQLDELERLIGLPDDEFVEFMRSHPRCRPNLHFPGVKTAKVTPVGPDDVDKAPSVSYKSAEKQRFHLAARTVLQRLAKALNLKSGVDYELRHNQGGIAVSGEITLHTDKVYIQISQWSFQNYTVMFRECNGRKDYSGGRNQWAMARDLVPGTSVFAAIKRMQERS